MSDAAELIRRLNHTPLRDLARGRLSGRLDVRARIDAAELPDEAKELVQRVIRRARLWRSERVDVADELLTHFADALAAEVSLDDALRDFGDEKQAAKLIRRAKRRNRPWWWQGLRGVGVLLLALILFYAGTAVLFYTGSPSPSVNYVEQLNRRILSVPVDDRAWPLYREALVGLVDDEPSSPTDAERRRGRDHWSATEPGDAYWPEVATYLRANKAAIELIRQGAMKPALGLPVGGSEPVQSTETTAWAEEWGHEAAAPTMDVATYELLLPHLGRLQYLMRVVDRHALLAASMGDAQTLMRDWRTLDGLAEHFRGSELLISQLVSIAYRTNLLDSVERVLTRHPELLSDMQLRDLAHQLAEPNEAADLLDFTVERMMFYDLVQRAYTDDGAGGGRITPEGFRLAAQPHARLSISGSDIERSSVAEAIQYAAEPGLLLLSAPREDLIAEYDRIMDRYQADLHLPAWEVDHGWFDEEVLPAWNVSPMTNLSPYWMISLTLPAYDAARRTAEQTLGRRDGLLVGIALELYRRRHGAYPSTLDELVPALLPEIPRDRITGEPVRYRVSDDVPVVYSVGGDRDDDGGEMPLSAADLGTGQRYQPVPMPDRAAHWIPAHAADGDWVLYPQRPAP